MDDPLTIWTVFDRPRDFPDKVIVRRFYVYPPGILANGEQVAKAPEYNDFDSVDAARLFLAEMGLTCIGRQVEDEPQIVESWV